MLDGRVDEDDDLPPRRKKKQEELGRKIGRFRGKFLVQAPAASDLILISSLLSFFISSPLLHLL